MEPERKARLGTKWNCYSCGVKFYDLSKPEPMCPKCSADQRESPSFEEKPKRPRKKPARKQALPAALPGGLDDDEIPAKPESSEPAGIDVDASGAADALLESSEEAELEV